MPFSRGMKRKERNVLRRERPGVRRRTSKEPDSFPSINPTSSLCIGYTGAAPQNADSVRNHRYREVGISSGNQTLTRCAFLGTDSHSRQDTKSSASGEGK